ncbi:MAG: endo-1,4-beta-xylanase, partial [bacterium]
MNRNVIVNFILCTIVAVNVYGQDDMDTISSKALKEVYAGKFLIGTAGDLRAYSNAELANIRKHYDILTPENCMKPQPMHPSEDTYNFTISDTLVQWCRDNSIKVWGHALAWHAQTAPWFFQEDPSKTAEPIARPKRPPAAAGNRQGFRFSMAEFWRRRIAGPLASREVAMERLKNHIMTVVGRYKGRIIGWDVFNESIADSGDCTTENLRTFSWYQVVGPDVLTMAFKWAHEADPDAQ